jgi:hypothetical protein
MQVPAAVKAWQSFLSSVCILTYSVGFVHFCQGVLKYLKDLKALR